MDQRIGAKVGKRTEEFDIDRAIADVNARLKAALIPARVQRNKNRNTLFLRATVPRRDGTPGNERRDFSFGIRANQDGLRLIEVEAFNLGGDLHRKTFDPKKYVREEKRPENKTIEQWLPEFREYWLAKGKCKEKTYFDTWECTFRKLPYDQVPTTEIFLATALSTNPNTSSRQLTCQRLQELAKFIGIEVDLLQYQGEYGGALTLERDLPDDKTIEEWRNKIVHPGWQWVFGMMATFGLRPHECFFCEFPNKTDPHTVDVLEGKTDYHRTHAIPQRWAEEWKLVEVVKPNVTGRSYRDYGDRTGTQFTRYKIPFVAYDLRHCFAIRASVVEGLPDSTAARMMGHSVAVHTRTYHRWLSNQVNEQVYRNHFKKKASLD